MLRWCSEGVATLSEGCRSPRAGGIAPAVVRRTNWTGYLRSPGAAPVSKLPASRAVFLVAGLSPDRSDAIVGPFLHPGCSAGLALPYSELGLDALLCCPACFRGCWSGTLGRNRLSECWCRQGGRLVDGTKIGPALCGPARCRGLRSDVLWIGSWSELSDSRILANEGRARCRTKVERGRGSCWCTLCCAICRCCCGSEKSEKRMNARSRNRSKMNECGRANNAEHGNCIKRNEWERLVGRVGKRMYGSRKSSKTNE